MLYVNPLEAPNLGRLQAATDPKAKEKLALQELEHLFLLTLLQEMRKTIPIARSPEAGPEKELYEEMLDDALSGAMAASGQLGIARQIEEQLHVAAMQHTLRPEVKPPTPGADK
jgi:Rod binding domain-containing protein